MPFARAPTKDAPPINEQLQRSASPLGSAVVVLCDRLQVRFGLRTKEKDNGHHRRIQVTQSRRFHIDPLFQDATDSGWYVTSGPDLPLVPHRGKTRCDVLLIGARAGVGLVAPS